MKSKRARGRALFIFIGVGLFGFFGFLTKGWWGPALFGEMFAANHGLTKGALAQILGDAGTIQRFPNEVELSVDDNKIKAIVQYSFDAELQESMEDLFKLYRPDYGAFVAIDAKTGRVLSMVSFSNGRTDVKDNLALRATFPSASVFKVVTAAAAIAERNFSANTVIPFNGRNHTLYKSHILKNNITRWTRYMTLRDAFAKSVNTVFGKIGAFSVGAEDLRIYADRFGFNRTIAADMPVQVGKAVISDDPWALAETASGYTQDNTMSPLHGALIAAAIVNDGVMMEPYAIESVHNQEGLELYRAQPKVETRSVDSATAAEIRALMRETVVRGTSSRSFRGFSRSKYQEINVGGKTGSLTGLDPKGKYDWFVGFADNGDQKLAIAALTVHEKYWRVKSSYLARRAVESYYKDKLKNPPTKLAKRRRL